MRLSAALAFLKCSSPVANIEAVRRKNIFLNCQQNAITSHKDVYIGKKRTSGSIWECWILDLTKIFYNTIKIVSEKKIKIGIYPFKHVYFKNRKVPRKKNTLTCKPWFIYVGESKIVWHETHQQEINVFGSS